MDNLRGLKVSIKKPLSGLYFNKEEVSSLSLHIDAISRNGHSRKNGQLSLQRLFLKKNVNSSTSSLLFGSNRRRRLATDDDQRARVDEFIYSTDATLLSDSTTLELPLP